MAIYHLEAKVVSRGAGRSAVAASAYLSCSRLYNDYDGIQHDYTKKQGLVWQQVFLPEYAPQEWKDREKLWNAVEEVETAKDSRLAREFVVALPIELSREEQIELLQEFIREQFISDGMCADAAIHDTDGHNPHAHILLTVRPLDEQGKWQYKTEKEYLCMKNGEERGFTAAEFRTAQNEGWEKQYPYKVGKKKVYMTPSAAEAQGFVRADKHPKSTRYGRQNPISERWNSEEQLAVWRAAWADATNRHLERYGHDERIDHRSNAARGLDEQPTIHEGVTARALGARLDVDVEVDEGLRERAFGLWEGLTHEEIRADWPERYEAWRAGEDPGVEGSEARGDCAVRVGSAVARLAADTAEGVTLVVVSHGAAVSLAVQHLLGLDPTVWSGMRGMDNCHWAELLPNARPFPDWVLATYNRGAAEAPSGVVPGRLTS